MKVLQIHTGFATGGIETMVTHLSNELINQVEVTVCSIFEPKETDFLWHSLNPQIRKEIIVNDHRQKRLLPWKIYKFIKRRRFDIVHVHGFFAYYALAAFLLRKRVKFIYTVHSDASKEGTFYDHKLFKLKRFFFKKNWLHPVTISEDSQKSFFELYGFNGKLIPNGIPEPSIKASSLDISKYRITPKTKIFINIGRIDVPKNQVALCKAVRNFADKECDVVLLIAGPICSKSIYNELKQYLSDRIIYIGAINNPCEYLMQADAFILPSIYEGLPVTLLEAMSVSCLPICTPIGGMKNVIRDGFNGVMSKGTNVNDIEDAICRFLNLSADQIFEIKANAFQTFIADYCISSTVKEYLKLYTMQYQ